METGKRKVELEGIEPSFPRCERGVLPLDDSPERRGSRGGIRTRTGAAFKTAVSPTWTTREITINGGSHREQGLATVVGAGGVEPLVGRL